MTDYEIPWWSGWADFSKIKIFNFMQAWSFFTTDPSRSVWAPGRLKKEVAAEEVVDQEFIPIIGGPLNGQFGGPESKLNNYRLIYYNNFYYFFKHNSLMNSQFLNMLSDCHLDAIDSPAEGENMNFKVMSVDDLFEELEEGLPIINFAENLLKVAKDLPESVVMKASGVIPGYENLRISPTEPECLVDDYEIYEQLFSAYLKSRGR